MPQGLRLLLEMTPLAGFFIVYHQMGLMPATGLLVALTAVTLTVTWLMERKLALLPLLAALSISLFGGLTLWLEDELFIKLRPTIINVLFASILLIGLLKGRGLLKPLFGTLLSLPDHAWKTLSLRWALFFLFLATCNELVWRNFSTDMWVNFKVFGLMPMTLIFSMTQIPFISRHMEPEEETSSS